MKIVLLTPALMLDNNREANKNAMQYALDNYSIDEYVCYDQEFKQGDYLQGYKYIGNQKERQGFVKPRNELLKYFYNSDYDYAFLIDANEKITTSSLNDLETVLHALKTGKIASNAILTTMGIQISAERMVAKQKKDYFDSVYLLRNKKGYEWIHGLIIRNYKKYYNHEIYIDERCNPLEGIVEDVYFVRTLHRLFECQLCPTIVASKPSNKTSTWQQNADSYAYPVTDNPTINKMIKENFKDTKIKSLEIDNIVKLDRIKDNNLQYLKKYKSRSSSLRKPTIKK